MREEFTSVLGALLAPMADVNVSSLADLTDLDDVEVQELSERWNEIGVARRRWIVRELIDLAEDNVELNFDRMYFRGLADEDAEVRQESIRGLWEYERADLITPLLRMMDGDESAAVRAEAALALGRFITSYEQGELRDRYFEAIERSMRVALENETEVTEVRARVLESIGAHNSEWVQQAIRDAYESDVRRLKASAIHAMGRSVDERWMPLVIREMSSEEAELRYEAALAAGAIGEVNSLPHLRRLAQDPDEEVAHASIMAMGEIGGAEAKAALEELAAEPSESLRQAAAAALAEIRFNEDPLAFGLN
jgi:HEAT repeat protein